MSKWYFKDGTPAADMDSPRWLEDMKRVEEKLRDFEYKIVKQEVLPDGKCVSTVWLGLDHNFFPSNKPLIFETMVFPKKGEYLDLDCERYSTEQEAIRGHKKMVKKWLKKGE